MKCVCSHALVYGINIKELLAYQRTSPSKRVWEDLAFDLLQLQKKTNIPSSFSFFEEWVESQKVNGLPNGSSGSFFTGLTDIDGLLSAMNFEEYDKKTGEDLYTDEEYDKAVAYHNMIIKQEVPNMFKY